MATDLQDKQVTPDADANDPYNREFAALTDPEHYGQDATPGEYGDGGRSSLYNPDGEGEQAGSGSKSSSATSPDGLQKMESSAAAIAGAAGVATGTAEAGIAAGGLYSGTDGGGIRQKLAMAVVNKITKKNGAIGGVVGLIVGSTVFFGGLVTGPLELMHLAQVLQHSFSKSESDSSNRTGHLFRYAKAWKNKNVGYTRVGLIGSKVMNGVLDDLSKAGVTIETNAGGRPTDFVFERALIEKNFPETKGMSNDEFRSFLEKTLGPTDLRTVAVDKTGKVTRFNLDVREFKFNSIKKLITKGQIGLVGDGKITASIKTRPLKKFFGLGALFHPFSTLLGEKLNGQVNSAAAKKETKDKAARDFENQVQQDLFSGTDGEGALVAEKVKAKADEQKNGPAKGIAIAGGVIITACIMHETASEIPKLDYYRIAAPAALQATSVIAQGAQLMRSDGGGNSEAQVGAAVASLTNTQGQAVWQSPALQALNNNPQPTNNKGVPANELDSKYKQAFAGHSTALFIDRAATGILNTIVDSALIGFIPGVTGTSLCNQYVQLGVAVVTIVASIVAAAGTGGTSAAVEAGVAAGESAAVQIFLVGSGIRYIQDWFINSSTGGRLAKEAFAGAVGGGLLAFGAREASNLAAIASGGISTGNDKSTFISEADRADQQHFRSESMFARVFDAKDNRSLAGHLADSISPSWYKNMSSALGSIQNIGGSLTGVFGSLIPHASAASTNSWSGDYNWGFPQYGIPDSMLSDETLADPYANANTVGTNLSNVCKDDQGNIGPQYGSCNGDHGYAARIKSCFNNDLSYESGVWDVKPTSDVNFGVNTNDGDPNNPKAYLNQSCDGVSDTNWKQIVMFINDTSTMKAVDCYAGGSDTSEQSCADEGLDISSAPAAPTGDISAYKNPLRDIKSPAPNRVDQGVDYGGSGGPVYSLGNGTVIHTADSGWPGGWFIVVKLDDGPAAGKFFYVSEGCPALVKIGQHVTPDTVLCNMQPGAYSIELGWAQDPKQGGWYAIAHNEYTTDGLATSYGQNFNQLLQKLGAAPGLTSGGSGSSGISHTPLPAGWPTW